MTICETEQNQAEILSLNCNIWHWRIQSECKLKIYTDYRNTKWY